MRSRKPAFHIFGICALAAFLFLPTWSEANPKVQKQTTSLPPKKKKTPAKVTRIEFSDSDGVVVAPRNSALNSAIKKAGSQQRSQEVQVQSRTFVPAPPGDKSEILNHSTSTLPQAAKPAPPVAKPAPPEPTPAPAIVVLPPPTFKLLNVEETPPTEEMAIVMEPQAIAVKPQVLVPDIRASVDAELGPQSTLIFLRTGYLHANYKTFDTRMKNGATSLGLGAARGFATTWGEFEARSSFDIYHSMDQSVTVDNVRMFAARTEVAYWFTNSRVRPALTFGLGWADYAVKSYRSINADGTGEVATLRTHAKSQAFSIIPGTALRIRLNDELVIDTQTEFLGLVGGESSDAVQGLAIGISFGWLL